MAEQRVLELNLKDTAYFGLQVAQVLASNALDSNPYHIFKKKRKIQHIWVRSRKSPANRSPLAKMPTWAL